MLATAAALTATLCVGCGADGSPPFTSPRADLGASGDDAGTPRTSRGDGATPEGDAGSSQQVTHLQLAEHYAPVWYQDTDSRNYKADYITRYDFDGDTRSDNNWNNLDSKSADLRAVIYYSVVETESHYFVLYTDFHPRDWAKSCSTYLIPGYQPCHENDMEGAMVVVRKVDGEPFGRFEVLYTEAHNALHIYSNEPSVARRSGRLESVEVTFEDKTHPELYVESKGHGVCALLHEASSHCQRGVADPREFDGGDGLVYRYKGRAEAPRSGNDRDVGYALRPLGPLWKRRADICDGGCTFDGEMRYAGMTLGLAFDGDDHGDDKANPPWAWDDPDDGAVARGDFFFRPAETLDKHIKLDGVISKTYLHNPYLQP